ncbi:histidine phosphotransferase family protein [Ruegeria arenilitoris]|uniref:histidine phosphotransferase family protein n=1 Tax=Ruegeria arenilitoris TaxID=1173585 RepID=UPI00147EEEF6|nr:histidine phosphotransferase family protein [Ruegeria arenilitoris]
MDDIDVNLAELVGSRICHDLISPVGAITNGLELLDMVGSVQGPEMELISGSVGNAAAKIRFFRVAFGPASDQPLGKSEIGSLLKDVENAGRLRVHWLVANAVTRNQAKLVFLALMCIESAMPLGGEATVEKQDNGWTVWGMADKLHLDSDLWKYLCTGRLPHKIMPSQVQFAMLLKAAASHGSKVTVETSSTRVAIRF